MTQEEITTFIKDKIAPVFDGMNAGDMYDILRDAGAFPDLVLSCFTSCRIEKEEM